MSLHLGLCLSPDQDNDLDANAVDVGGLVREAVEGVGCSHKVAAALVGYNADYWTRVLGNERGIVLGRLGRLPRDVQREIVARWAKALGLRIDRRDNVAMRAVAASLAEAAAKLAEVV